MGNQAPRSTVGKIQITHPNTGGSQWVSEKAFDAVWSEKGWLRAEADPGQAEEEGADTATAQTTDDRVES